MATKPLGPLSGYSLGPIWVDSGTMCLNKSAAPGPSRKSEPAVLPGSGYLFVIFEQLPAVGAGKIIRKVALVPKDFSLKPANPFGAATIVEHVWNVKPTASPFLSASTRPFGAPSIQGVPLLLDVAKIEKAGGKIFTTKAIVQELKAFSALHPSSSANLKILIETIQKIEGEVLVKGSTPAKSATRLGAAHLGFVNSAESLWRDFSSGKIAQATLETELDLLENSYRKMKVVGKFGRAFSVIGLVMTVADVAKASNQSVQEKSFKPIAAESIRQVGGWGAAIAGAKIGAVTGGLVGVSTGPGAIVTGAIGAVVFGAAGYFGADWVADQISPN